MFRSYLRSALLGGVDGIITSFAIVAGASFLSASGDVVAVVGSSSLVADGVSMGVSEYLSTSSERNLQQGTVASSKLPRPLLMGLTCFLSFVACGALPLVAFVLGDNSIVGSASTSFLLLLLLALTRTLVTGEVILWGLVEVTSLGTLASAIAFAVAALSSSLLSPP